MNEEENAKIEDIEVNNEYEVVKTKKEEFDDILAKIEKMAEALEKKLIFLPKNDSL